MTELITFHFQGGLADEHRMNFYESARFQYAAARLLVKLAQFRSNGRFVQKITNGSNVPVNLVSHDEGSFNINVEDGDGGPGGERFADLPLSDLVAYVSERVVEKIDETTMRQVDAPLSANSSSARKGGGETPGGLDLLAAAVIEDGASIDHLPAQIQDLVRRRVAEMYRERRLEESRGAISRIDVARSQKLIAMAAPLISDMATALRKSADTLEVTVSGKRGPRPVLYLNRQMAQEIETALVDKEITPILCDIIQFNKDNGWGKLKIEDNEQKALSFSIPYDVLPFIRQQIIDQMKRDRVYLQAYFVRNVSGEAKRLIAVGILPTPER